MGKKKYMAPEWIMYPEISESSIGWRMGYGESYRYDLYDWLETLSEEEKREYKEKFPKPIMWNMMQYTEFQYHDYYIRKWKTKGYHIESLIKERNSGIKKDIVLFWGHTKKEGKIGKECFSQWYPVDFRVNADQFWCMEQFMMSQKAKLFGDQEIFEKIMGETEQKKIKQLGRKVSGFDQKIWDQVKYDIVLTGNYYKFSENSKLRTILLDTGDSILAEASPYDKIWGIGFGAGSQESNHPEQWKGINLLGFALMEVREEIRRLRKYEDEIFNIEVETTI